MSESIFVKNDAKKVFRTKGACSHTFFYLLNREYGYNKDREERAANPLAGGIFQLGYQCGMLWGASLAAGAEAYRRFEDINHATAVALKATQKIMESFIQRTDSYDCEDIAECDWDSKLSMAKYFITGKFLSCFTLAEKWAPEAVNAANEGLKLSAEELPDKCLSCASELLKKIGATEEQMVMVAGFAGGLGLSGNACGALSAAIWMKSFLLDRKAVKKSDLFSPELEKVLEDFYKITEFEILCSKITGTTFDSLENHTEYISNGGCEKIIEKLAESL